MPSQHISHVVPFITCRISFSVALFSHSFLLRCTLVLFSSIGQPFPFTVLSFSIHIGHDPFTLTPHTALSIIPSLRLSSHLTFPLVTLSRFLSLLSLSRLIQISTQAISNNKWPCRSAIHDARPPSWPLISIHNLTRDHTHVSFSSIPVYAKIHPSRHIDTEVKRLYSELPHTASAPCWA